MAELAACVPSPPAQPPAKYEISRTTAARKLTPPPPMKPPGGGAPHADKGAPPRLDTAIGASGGGLRSPLYLSVCMGAPDPLQASWPWQVPYTAFGPSVTATYSRQSQVLPPAQASIPKSLPPAGPPSMTLQLGNCMIEAAPCWDATCNSVKAENKGAAEHSPQQLISPVSAKKTQSEFRSPSTCSGSENDNTGGFNSDECNLQSSGSEADLPDTPTKEKSSCHGLSPAVSLPPGLEPPPGLDLLKDVLSSGSLYHFTEQCRPCGWFWKAVGCKNGKDCSFCHLCPKNTLQKRKKLKRQMLSASGPSKEGQGLQTDSAH